MASAIRCHLGSTVAWKSFASQILVNRLSPLGSSFAVGTGSTAAMRHKDIVGIAYGLASKIASQAREQLATVPAPSTAPDSLTAAGIVDGALFPSELISSCLPALVNQNVQHFDNWSRDWDSFDEPPITDLAAVLLHAITYPINPYTHVRTLGFLAQQADVDFLNLLEIPHKRGASVLRSVDEILELPRSTQYTSTSVHYDLYWREGAIGRYIDLTLRYYIYLNLLIAVDSNDALQNGLAQELTDFPGRHGFCSLSRPDDEPVVGHSNSEYEPLLLPEHDTLHHPFWAANGDRDPERMQLYLQRCFDVIVAWYALMETASDRNRAIGMWPEISFDDVVGGILEAFKSFGDTFALPPFKFPLGNFLKEHVNNFTYPEAQIHTHVDAIMTPELPNWKSNLVDLPSGLLDIIASLLPPAGLVAFSQVPRSIRMNSIKTLFADPFGESDSQSREEVPTVIDVLLSSSDLREAVHRGLLHVGEPLAGVTGYSHYLTARQGIDFFSPLALQLPNLRKMDLVIQSTQLWNMAGTNNIYPLFQIAQSRWPNLRSIDIIYHQVDAENWHKLSSSQKAQALQHCPGDAGVTWKLESISFERYLVAEYDAHTDTPGKYLDDHIPLVPLLSSSVDTLHTLSLNTCKKDIGDVSSFPICPYVTKLALTSNFTSQEVSGFLSKFPALRDLEVSLSDWAQEESDWPWASSGPGIDFANVAPGLRSLAVAFYDIASIPDSCLRLSGVGENNPELVSSGPFPFVQKKTNLVKELVLVGYREEPLEQAVPRLALDHPSVVYLEIQQPYFGFNDYEDLVVAAILENFLQLETLVLPQGLKSYPRRSDVPSGTFDRQDEKEKKEVLRLFKKSKALKVVALRGVPSDHDDPYQVSKKVWVRSADGGARMAGREAIPVIN